MHQGVEDSIPGQGTCLGCGFDPQLGGVYGRRPTDVDVSLTSMLLSLPPPSSLSKTDDCIVSSGEDLEKKFFFSLVHREREENYGLPTSRGQPDLTICKFNDQFCNKDLHLPPKWPIPTCMASL